MRLIVHDFGGFAFSAQLSSVLATRGHDVLYLHSKGFRPNKLGRRQPPASSRLATEAIHIGRPARAALGLRRLSDERKYGGILAKRIADFRPEVVISANTPLDGQSSALDAAHARVLGLSEGDRITWGEAKERIASHMTLEAFHEACAPCEWKALGVCEAALTSLVTLRRAR